MGYGTNIFHFRLKTYANQTNTQKKIFSGILRKYKSINRTFIQIHNIYVIKQKFEMLSFKILEIENKKTQRFKTNTQYELLILETGQICDKKMKMTKQISGFAL